MIHHLNLKNGSRGKSLGAATKMVGSAPYPQPHTPDPEDLKQQWGMRSRLPWSSCPTNLVGDTPNPCLLRVGHGGSTTTTMAVRVLVVVPQYLPLDQSIL